MSRVRDTEKEEGKEQQEQVVMEEEGWLNIKVREER